MKLRRTFAVIFGVRDISGLYAITYIRVLRAIRKDSLTLNQILFSIIILSFLTIWVVIVIFYTPSCFRLRAMIDQIDKEGELKKLKVNWRIGRNTETLNNWLISIPTSNTYLQYDILTSTVNKIQTYRTILGVATALLIISALVLLANI